MNISNPHPAPAEPTQKENAMTTTTARPVETTNPHHVPALITLWAIPLVFIGALWGAGNNPENAEWSGFAFLLIVGLHVMKRVQRNAWNRRNSK